MDLIPVLRMLARRRLLLAAGLLVAALAGVLLAFRLSLSPFELSSRQGISVSASGSVLVDASPTRPVDPGTDLAMTLPLRAGLLADLLSTDAARAQIAGILGAHPDEVAVFGPAAAEPFVPVPTAARGSEAATATGERYVLMLTSSATVPIITLRAVTLDRRAASALVDAGIATLRRVAATGPSPSRAMRLVPLGRPRVTVQADNRHVGVAVAGALFVLCAWIAAIGLLDRVASARRTRRVGARLSSRHDPDVHSVGRRAHTG